MFSSNRITHLQNPTRLCLVWNQRAMTRYRIGELTCGEDGNVTLRYLAGTPEFNEAKEHGFSPILAFRDEDETHSLNVMDYFMSRITSRERGDFDLYLQTLGIDPSNKDGISNFALLGYGEGRLPGDGYHVVNPYEDATAPLEFVTEVAGLHFGVISIDQIGVDETVVLVAEPKNKADANAVRMEIGGRKLGYVNRIQAPAVKGWMERGHIVSGSVFRTNGLPSGPRVFVFLEVSGSATTQ
jgi:hypothetical protein